MCENNRIVCVKKYISEFVSGDRNKYLWLKAQIEIHRKYTESKIPILSNLIAILSLLCTILNTVLVINQEDSSNKSILIKFNIALLIILVVLIVMLFVMQKSNKKYSSTDKLIEYITVVLDDMGKNNITD